MKMEACAEIDKALGATICKNLFLCNRPKTSFYLLMMCADKHFATRSVSDQVGSSRLGFADEEYLEKFLDITPGSVSVLGLMNDKENRVQLLMDEDILAGEYFGCHPCINTTSLRIKTKDLIEKILPAMGHAPKIVHLD
jgi:Ala-tRNA(Pro) deacylase